jgi:hypothetical protein
MPHDKDDKQQPPPNGLIEGEELDQARALLQDPAQVAPVDTQKFGRRLSEILMWALRRNARKKRR